MSETTVDTTMAKVSVNENSRNSRPTIPSMKISGVNAATSDRLIDSTVKPICLAPSSAAGYGAMPCSRLRYMFSIMTMASSTTKPTEIASAISDRLSIEKPASHIPAQVPASASGTETPAAIVGVSRRRKTNTTSMTRKAVASRVNCMSSTLARMVPVRSTSVEISTPPGSHCFSSGNSALTRSTVSMTLASPCLVIWIRTAGCLLNQAIERLLRTESSTSATSARRTKLPAELLMMMSRNSAAVRICLLVEIVSLWRPPLKMPTGPSGLALMMASRTSSVAISAFDSATGLSAIRTAGWSAPVTLTSPTPGTCEIRCAITVSAMSYIALVVSVFDVSASTNTGAAEGLALRNRGIDGRSLGRSASDALIAACTSRAARSMSRPIENCNWMLVVPSELVEVICSMPAIWPSRRSSGAATVAAITEGSAPGRVAETRIIGNSTLGTAETGRKT